MGRVSNWNRSPNRQPPALSPADSRLPKTWSADTILIVERSGKVLIVGAGIGGLAAGVALRRRGWNVRIYDRARNVRELGFGLLLAPNAIAALSELGIVGSVVVRTAPATGLEIRRLNGRVIRRFNSQLGGPAVVALRRDLHDALLNAIGHDALNLSSEAVAVSHDRAGVKLRLADGSTDTGAVLIGADGVHSIVRRQLHPNETPLPSGFSAVRGMAYGVSSYLGGLSGVGYLDSGIEAAATRAGSDAVYWYVSLLSHELPSEASSAEAILAKRLNEFDPAFQAIIVGTSRTTCGTTSCSNVIRFPGGALDALPCLAMPPILCCRTPARALHRRWKMQWPLASCCQDPKTLRRRCGVMRKYEFPARENS
jgi:hypothetical protein